MDTCSMTEEGSEGDIQVKDLTGDGKIGEKRRLEYVKEPYENTQAWKLFTKIIC